MLVCEGDSQDRPEHTDRKDRQTTAEYAGARSWDHYSYHKVTRE